jgi:hypothetical protein
MILLGGIKSLRLSVWIRLMVLRKGKPVVLLKFCNLFKLAKKLRRLNNPNKTNQQQQNNQNKNKNQT